MAKRKWSAEQIERIHAECRAYGVLDRVGFVAATIGVSVEAYVDAAIRGALARDWSAAVARYRAGAKTIAPFILRTDEDRMLGLC